MATGKLLENSQLADYLFSTQTRLVEFVVIEEELARLNDYCVAVSQAIHNELAQQQTVRQELEDGPEYHESDDGPIHRSEILLGLDDIEIPRWQEVNNFMMPATQILLLNVLVERSLKSLCAEYDPENRSRVYGGHTARVRSRPGQSKLGAYLEFLRDPCGLDATGVPSVNRLDGDVRFVRNAFAHGDWDKAEVGLSGLSVREAFEAASELFAAIESLRDAQGVRPRCG